jgi:hypothetical protein
VTAVLIGPERESEGIVADGVTFKKAAKSAENVLDAGWLAIPAGGTFQLAEKQAIMGLVKDGKIIGIADPIKAGISHLQMAEKLGIKLENGNLPQGVESFLVQKYEGDIKVIGGGASNFKISPDAKSVVEKIFQ